ncbi:cytochrome P450 726A27-like [Salvia hispanica]|uniref:cytochrome P450 726A27-like n=1 Tax=Salvia hispanica TaxID=49212 RepID=UPI00200944F7|nr:cytochrome P450 726A27-like [Salvia hispanica]
MTSVILEVTHLATGFMLADLYPSVKLLPWITRDQMKIQRMYRKIDRLLDSIIEEHKADKAAGDGGGEVDDLMDVLLRIQQDGTEYPLTTQNIKAVVLNRTESQTPPLLNYTFSRNPSKNATLSSDSCINRPNSSNCFSLKDYRHRIYLCPFILGWKNSTNWRNWFVL